MPLSDMMAFMLETPENPTHIGGIQIFEPEDGDCSAAIGRILKAFRESPVAAPFNLAPKFPKFGRPKWVVHENYDPAEHVLHLAVPHPGTEQQLIELVTRLHAGIMDRSKPCWQVYLIEGLAHNRFAMYFKLQHAYLDGAALVARFNATMGGTPERDRPVPFWAPLPELEPAPENREPNPAGRASSNRVIQELGTLLGKATRRYRGLDDSLAPLPLSAPDTVFNSKVGKKRSLGVGSLDLAAVRDVAKKHRVTINDLVLTLVGHALEHYSDEHGNMPERELVAVCPMSLRRPGDNSAGNQIIGIYVRLGVPGSELEERLKRVHHSSVAAKDDAKSVSNQALMTYLVMTGGTAELLSRVPRLPGIDVPRQANVNVSNVPGPGRPYYLGDCRMVRTYPVSTLAGGTAINITFGSLENHLDYSIVADGLTMPDVQLVADHIADAFEQLAKNAKRIKPTTEARK